MQFALVRSEPQNRVEGGGLARAVRADDPENAAFFDAQVDAVQRHRFPERFAQSARLYACHGVQRSSLPRLSRGAVCRALEQFLRRQTKALNSGLILRPFLGQKLLPFALQQQLARARFDEHAEPSPDLDQIFVDQLLIALENRERVDPIFGRDVAHRRQRIAFLEYAVENHRDHAVAKLAVNRLPVVPLTVHPVVPFALAKDTSSLAPLQIEVRVDIGFSPGIM